MLWCFEAKFLHEDFDENCKPFFTLLTTLLGIGFIERAPLCNIQPRRYIAVHKYCG